MVLHSFCRNGAYRELEKNWSGEREVYSKTQNVEEH